MHDPEPGKRKERRQARTPDPVLERRLRHDRHAGRQEQFQHAEERRQRPHRQVIPRSRHEPGSGVRHPLLDLVPADRRAANRARDLARERRLARARRPADDNQGRARSHSTVRSVEVPGKSGRRSAARHPRARPSRNASVASRQRAVGQREDRRDSILPARRHVTPSHKWRERPFLTCRNREAPSPTWRKAPGIVGGFVRSA